MNKKEFNEYCAEVKGHELDWSNIQCNNGLPSYINKHGKSKLYNPYDDANQRHEVFDKLWNIATQKQEEVFYASLWVDNEKGINQAEREFIWSTKWES